MGDDEKMNENIAVAKLNEDMEKKLLQLSLDDIFGILHCKAKENPSGTCAMEFSYLNVHFSVSCEILPDKIVPRGYDDV